jgi:hypothetical protein
MRIGTNGKDAYDVFYDMLHPVSGLDEDWNLYQALDIDRGY